MDASITSTPSAVGANSSGDKLFYTVIGIVFVSGISVGLYMIFSKPTLGKGKSSTNTTTTTQIVDQSGNPVADTSTDDTNSSPTVSSNSTQNNHGISVGQIVTAKAGGTVTRLDNNLANQGNTVVTKATTMGAVTALNDNGVTVKSGTGFQYPYYSITYDNLVEATS